VQVTAKFVVCVCMNCWPCYFVFWGNILRTKRCS